MWEEDENDIAIFEFYKKLPLEEQKKCEVFITPEKILEIQVATDIDKGTLQMHLIALRAFDINTFRSLILKKNWKDYTLFKRIVAAIKEYYKLRPEVIENYPELLI